MKIKFYCYQCREAFNVSDRYLIKKDSVICPNCSLQLNEKSFISLKNAIQSLSEAHSANDNNQRIVFNIIDDVDY